MIFLVTRFPAEPILTTVKVFRWIAMVPAGFGASVIVMFPIHWLLVITMEFGESPYFGLLSPDAIETFGVNISHGQ